LDKHLFIIAGEESGDQHASVLLKEIKQLIPEVQVSGLGGQHLQAQGMQNILDLTQLAITGITGVLSHLKAIRHAFKLSKKYLLEHRPDVVILVDYPGFNLRMAKWIKNHLGCPVIYYISPQIWAWKAQRIEIIKRYVDHMAVILPFEKAIYEQAKVSVSYVGHPLRESLLSLPSPKACREFFALKENDSLLAILPGSRKAEIDRHMPIIVQSIKKLKSHPAWKDLKLMIPVAKSLKRADFLVYLKDLPEMMLIDGQAQKLVQAADAVVVASGTASLECAILAKPCCIIYKSSWLNYYLATRWMKVKYLGLANLLMNQMLIPELLQADCNPQELSKMLQALLEDSLWRNSMVGRLKQLKLMLLPAQGQSLGQTVFDFLTLK
jgi:lipid-A-disaccharide synthase